MRLPSSPTYRGPHDIPLYAILEAAWRGGVAVSSNLARSSSVHVALAASAGYISTIEANGASFGGSWRITALGLAVLEAYHKGD